MPRKLLVVYSAEGTSVATTAEYVRSFRRYSRHDVSYINGAPGVRLGVELSEFDAVWLNYCCRLCFPGYVSSNVREALRTYRGLKLMSVQDEYDRTETLRQGIEELGFDVVFTCVPQDALGCVYPRERFPNTEFVTVLTGYVPEHLERVSNVTPLERRPIVIGYRGRDIGARYGELGFWKFEIGRRMKEICLERGIRCDIEWTEEARIYGDSWYTFVESCRTMLGSESGSNVFDFDGSIEEEYKRLKGANAGKRYEEFRAHIAQRENAISMGQISPRVFEAAALRTPLILLTGRYSGLVKPGEHYIELRKDFSNVDDVLRQAGDIGALKAMAERAHRQLISSGSNSYRHFIGVVDGVIERRGAGRAARASMAGATPQNDGLSRESTPEERSTVIEVPTPYPFDGSYYYRKEIDRLNTAYMLEVDQLRSEIERLKGTLSRVMQTQELIRELVRKVVLALLGPRLGSVVSRVIVQPSDVFTKTRVLVQMAVGVYPVRRLLLEYLRDRSVRREIGYRMLLRDLIRIEIVRQAREGKLIAREPFCVAVTFAPESGVMTMKSAPVECGLPGTTRCEGTSEDGGHSRSELAAALRVGGLRSMVWDHSALGSQILCAPGGSMWLNVLVGEGGVHRFEALGEMVRRRPERVGSILLPMIGGESARGSTTAGLG